MTNLLMLAASASVLAMSTVAAASPITYTGSQQVGQILANYSITTDGTFGDIDTSHLTTFNVALSEGNQPAITYSRIASQGGTGSWNGTVVASATSLTIAFFESLSLFTNATNQAGGYFGDLEFRYDSSVSQLTDATYPNGLYQTAVKSNRTVPFATAATAAVPEPATWGMMVLGFGAMGFAMRRRQKVAVSYAA